MKDGWLLKDNYRLRIVEELGHRTYLVRWEGQTSYVSAAETPLALANLVQDDAAELRFLLQDAKDGCAAAGHLRRVLTRRWARNPKACPTVEVMR